MGAEEAGANNYMQQTSTDIANDAGHIDVKITSEKSKFNHVSFFITGRKYRKRKWEARIINR